MRTKPIIAVALVPAVALAVIIAARILSPGSGSAGPSYARFFDLIKIQYPETMYDTTRNTPSINPLLNEELSGVSSQVEAVLVGGDQVCALFSDRGLKCWGYNYYGSAGNGDMEPQPNPVDVSGISGEVSSVSTGAYHSCAVTTSGGLKCWGFNYTGQLGDGTTADKSVPVDVFRLDSGVISATAGGFHTCAVAARGGLKCWGRNIDGELGDGSTGNKSIPADVYGLLSGVKTVSCGIYHTCALTESGAVMCWGDNFFGELGDGTTQDKSIPSDVAGLDSGVTDISSRSGLHSCALMETGSLKCWGWNQFGQLGDGTTANRLTPVNVAGLGSTVKAVSAGGYHTCALLNDGGVRCWGRNALGELGDGSYINRPSPVLVMGLTSGVKAVSAGGSGESTDPDQTCVILNKGALQCWGFDQTPYLPENP